MGILGLLGNFWVCSHFEMSISVELIDFMGDDVRVAEAARVSFDAEAGVGAEVVEEHGRKRRRVGERDAKLITYLGKHNHWTPFAHIQITFMVTAPIYVARQLFKHMVGLVCNEISRRYVDTTPKVYVPPTWRLRSKDKKQGSHPTETVVLSDKARALFQEATQKTMEAYNTMIAEGVAPEQARGVLPLATMTSWYWTGSLAAFARVCKLRMSDDAQAETRMVAVEIDKQLLEKYPKAWEALMS